MALCHDLGKIHTASNVLPHHYGHEKRGVELARNLGRRLGMPSRYIRAGAVGTAQHMKGGMYGTLRSGTRRDMLIQIYQTGIFHDFWVLAGADGGWNWEPQAKRDLTAILRVQLPLEWQNRGAASGKHLRELQCEVLSHLPGMDPLRADNAPQFYAEHSEIY
jgi:tRNA nucleotidyltransferase (CCA-adding enzyme)